MKHNNTDNLQSVKNSKSNRLVLTKRSCMICIAIICMIVNLPVFASSSSTSRAMILDIPLNEQQLTSYEQDAEGNALGISDYWVDNGKIFLLSSTYNKIIVYDEGEKKM